ncbi:uncharacterized protein N7484_010567 [Penicillium longicatenatum]|uniref:uncharacterized protein n=1 Tax=Penicillium longicatenatum TaxID=1561947 RepID=UPI002547CAF5|nr:uncharacterized protein N7484_010567 [Penicillium longicatenatum]KAJ5630467.1 hypothetical protein N7484_010567 [Penicillium longicatenatum]
MTTYRPAELVDLPQIRAIGEYYILNTSLASMEFPPPLQTYEAKWHELKDCELPFLVAVREADTKGASEKPETVLGYAYLSPFREHLLSYGPTVELSLFVHPDHQSCSVGSTLLKNLLDLVRSGKVSYRVKEDRHSACVNGDESKEVELHIVRNIVAIMAVDPEGEDGGEALRRWYIQRGFEEQGRLKRLGFKRGHW